MTMLDTIRKRILLKEQLIVLVRTEIGALERELKDLDLEPSPQSGHEEKGGKD
jgi:hypothetical protein